MNWHGEQITVLDFFSGIGGFSLGLEATGGFRTVGFCEANEFRRKVLRKHWPGVPICTDIHSVPDDWSAECIVGGPPCQGTSVAAAISGKRDGRTLWPQMFVQIQRKRPALVIVEQPPGNKKWEAKVTADLEGIGYHVARLERSARSCGAPDLRRRVFIIANPDRERCKAMEELGKTRSAELPPWPAPPRGAWRSPRTGHCGVDAWVPDWVDRIEALGDSVSPVVVAEIGRIVLAALK